MSDWDKYAKPYGLETGAGYKEVFLHHQHFSKTNPSLLNRFKEDETYVTFDQALEAIRRAEVAIKEKYNIK